MPEAESTWPRMTAAPGWPGAGPYSYHPARLWSPSGGTWTVPSAFLPSLMTGALTPMAGIRMRTGTERASACTCGSRGRAGTAVVTDAGTPVAPASGDRPWASANAATLAPPAHATEAVTAAASAHRPGGLRRWRGRYTGQAARVRRQRRAASRPPTAEASAALPPPIAQGRAPAPPGPPPVAGAPTGTDVLVLVALGAGVAVCGTDGVEVVGVGDGGVGDGGGVVPGGDAGGVLGGTVWHVLRVGVGTGGGGLVGGGPLCWLAAWPQLLCCAAVVSPEASSPSAPDRPDAGTWMPSTLTATVSLHSCPVTWLLRMLTRLPLPLPPPPRTAALAAGAPRPIVAAVATANAKAQFFPDIVCLPP